MVTPAFALVLIFRPCVTVYLRRPPAFTLVLIFIPVYSFFSVYVKPQRHVPGFEASDRGLSLIKATARGEN